MKPAKIFQQYIWLVTLLMRHKRLTLDEISQRWEDDKVIDGKPLLRSSFYRHKDAILNMFGIIIECDTEHGYKYYIGNDEVLEDESVQKWLLSTLSVDNIISESLSMQKRILLQSVPAEERAAQTRPEFKTWLENEKDFVEKLHLLKTPENEHWWKREKEQFKQAKEKMLEIIDQTLPLL